MTRHRQANFDRLARIYRALEFVAFGRDLERARFAFLDRISGAGNILVLGEGDGRCLVRLLDVAPRAHIRCVDSSQSMLALAAQRIPPKDRHRVTLTCADIFAVDLPAASFDAVTTLFFLDCFSTAEVGTVVRRVAPSLQPQATWLFADFVMPPGRLAGARARIWLAVLYAFFRWQTGIKTRTLPDSEKTITGAGFNLEAKREYQHGLLRSSVFGRRT